MLRPYLWPIKHYLSYKILRCRYISHLTPKVFKNLSPLLQTIKDQLEYTLSLSLMGRISAVKMEILSLTNFLLTGIPAAPSLGWFSSLHSIRTKFYWGKKKQSNDRHYKNPTHKVVQILITILSQITCSIGVCGPESQTSTLLGLKQTIAQELPVSDSPVIDKSNQMNPNLISALKWIHQNSPERMVESQYTFTKLLISINSPVARPNVCGKIKKFFVFQWPAWGLGFEGCLLLTLES